jgi:tetratricopeptide (TPR) repeat protein
MDIFAEKYHQRRGLRLLHKTAFEKAAYHLEKALVLNASTVNLFYFAVALVALNRHTEAVVYLEKVIDEHVDNLLISTTLVECYLVIREWEKAEKLVNYLHTKNPENSTVKFLYETTSDPIIRDKYACGKEQFFLAKDAMNKKDLKVAYEHISRAVELDEKNAAYLFYAAYILLMDRRPKIEVEQYLEKAVLYAPQNEGYKRQLQFVKTKYKGK